MTRGSRSPCIEELSWGRIRVDGLRDAKDYKLWPGGGREWDWNETGTRHRPGIQPADVEELVEKGARTVILSKGMLERLHTCPETIDKLKSQDINVYIKETRQAVALYNRLALEGDAVGGLFHSTC